MTISFTRPLRISTASALTSTIPASYRTPMPAGRLATVRSPGVPGSSGLGPPPDSIGAVASFTLTAVPEASTWAMMLAGFAGLGLAGYRRTAMRTVG
ncbi:MAG: PEP-CTERM sorting domain-containing protein [Hyphomicrobiales bacterium]|nr:PEP-CTERM sorting domain-containing protein [Hyphomicrobiales bacterium]